jgi:hypothetical protein
MGETQRAAVEQMLAARHVRPDEKLAVRLLGTVGPDGSWALDGVDVQREPGRCVLVPRVKRVPGDFFVQMVVQLDHTVILELPAGKTRVEAQGRDSVLVCNVEVAPDVRRDPPNVRCQPSTTAPAGVDSIVTLQIDAEVADGFVDRVEVREVSAGTTTEWRAADFTQREESGVRASVTIRRPRKDAERRVEARVTDGQGVTATTTFVLPRL